MKNNFKLKATGLLLVCQMTLSSLPVVAMAQEHEDLEENYNIEKLVDGLEEKQPEAAKLAENEPVDPQEQHLAPDDTQKSEARDMTDTNAFSEQVLQMNTQGSPIYSLKGLNKRETLNTTGSSAYIFNVWIEEDANGLPVFNHDISKHFINYGARVTFSNGQSAQTFKNAATGSHMIWQVNLNDQLRPRRGDTYTIRDLNPSGNPIHAAATGVLMEDRYYEDDRQFGQSVYDLFVGDTFEQLQEGVTQQIIASTRSNLEDQMFPSEEKQRLLGLLSSAEDILANQKISDTTLNGLTTESTQASGEAEPNATISIRVGETELASGRVGSDGKYSVTIEKQQAGTVVTAQARLGDIESNIAETTVIREGIDETTISKLNTDSTSVTGTAEPNAEITIKAGDTVIANGRVGSDGIYSLTIEKQPAGTVITAQATLNGISSNIAETMVERATIAETTLNEVTTTDTTVSGTAEPNAQVEITIGDETKNATVDSDGKFSVEIDPQTAGTIITAQASIDGLQSNIASTIVVNDPANTEGTITPDTYNISSGEQFLRGTYTGDVASARVYVNGSSVRGGNFAEGSFEFFIGNRIQSVDDVVEIEALDQYGKVLDRTTVELTRDLAGTITPDQYRVGEAMITGTFTGDVNFARLVINGTPSNAWGGTFNADGTFSFYVANLGIKAGDKVEIQALNRQINGNTEAIEVLETKEVTVIDQLQGTITPDQYSYTDTMITGTFTGDINFANLVIDGQSVGNWGGTFNKETGRFEFFVHAQFREQIRTAAKVELQTYHRETVDGQTIDHKLVLQPVEIVRATGTIQPAAFKVTDSEITGTFTGNVNFANLIVDGRSVSWGGTFNTTDQTFTYFVNQDTRNLIRDAKTVELVAYHREVVNGRPVDTELDRSVVTIDKEFTGTITPNPYKLGDRIVTGTYTGEDINFGRLEIDGMILWVSGFADGTFTAYLNQEQANSVTKDSQMTIYALHRFADLSTQEIAQATVSITE
ncbi:Ig-like domain-containing protein [Enterococcus casseliflavus]|uniref:immunoglobulin-like domain-containing protein n=1 Tax=Enterococcus casseliflavus TaxID=37734 RepID=UPI0023D9C668|nr:immunoglobulin-like domain-containing protein [Enterococcus casseliflavus]WEL46936.1 Ig-like domain-containing protein [Enterococcus casseliflavus]